MARQSGENRASQAVLAARGMEEAWALLMLDGTLNESRSSAMHFVLFIPVSTSESGLVE
jgi:hypothetical protein